MMYKGYEITKDDKNGYYTTIPRTKIYPTLKAAKEEIDKIDEQKKLDKLLEKQWNESDMKKEQENQTANELSLS